MARLRVTNSKTAKATMKKIAQATITSNSVKALVLWQCRDRPRFGGVEAAPCPPGTGMCHLPFAICTFIWP
jgi:hypothetical protein